MVNGVSVVVSSLSDGWPLYLGLLTITSLFCFLVFRRYIYSILDPLALVVIGFCFQFTTIQYIFFNIGIRLEYYLYSNLAFLLFWLSFMFFAIKVDSVHSLHPRLKLFLSPSRADRSILRIFFIFSGITYFPLLVAQYVIFGFNFGAEENFSYHRTVELGGVFPRVLNSLGLVFLIICIYNIFILRKGKLFSVCCLFLFLLTALPTAGKAFFYGVAVVYAMLSFSGLNPKQRASSTPSWILAIGSVVAGVLILLYTSEDLWEAIFRLAYRFLMFSDIFMFSYIDETLSLLDFGNSTSGFFTIGKDLIGFLRIISWDDLPPELGNRILIEVTGEETMKGPNPTHVVFGFFYFQWAGLFLSIFSGALLGVARGKMLVWSTRNIFSFIAYFFFYKVISTFFVDPSFSIQIVVNCIVVVLPVYFAAKLVKLAASSRLTMM